MRRKEDNAKGNDSISFFTWKRNLENISASREYQEDIINSSLLDQELNSEIIVRVNYSNEELEALKRLNVSYNSLFSNLKWLLEIESNMVPVSQYLKVFRGSRRGWDPMFFPSSETNIESQFLKDVLMNARSTDSYIAQPTIGRKAFCCDMELDELEEQGYLGTLKWIQSFSRETNETGRPLPEVLARTNMRWYELTTDEEAEIFTMMNPDDRMFYAKFLQLTFINQRLIGLKRKRATDNLDLLHALLNSILSLFYIEAVGFGRGLGVLDINKDSISKCYILNPALLTEGQATDIMEKFSALAERGIVDISQDLNDPIRQEFDRAVLNAFGIGDYFERIVESLKAMRRIRKAVNQRVVELRPPRKNENHRLEIEQAIGLAAEGIAETP